MGKILIMNLMSILSLIGCSTPSNLHSDECSIVFYENGQAKNVVIDNPNKIRNYVINLVQGIDNSFKMMVTRRTIEDAKKKDCAEITFSKEISITMNNGNNISFSKILVTFKNIEEISKSSSIVFYCGKQDYFSPPYINSMGTPIAEEIRKICEKSFQSK